MKELMRQRVSLGRLWSLALIAGIVRLLMHTQPVKETVKEWLAIIAFILALTLWEWAFGLTRETT